MRLGDGAVIPDARVEYRVGAWRNHMFIEADLEGMTRGRTGPYLSPRAHAGVGVGAIRERGSAPAVRFPRLNNAQLEVEMDGQVTRLV